jgi:FkbM family methyltransferase
VVDRLEMRLRAWKYRLRLEGAEIGWMLGKLAPGDAVVDVGAYKGAYTYWMRRAVGPRGSVLAVEPQPDAATFLRSFVAAFGWTNVTVVEAALSSAPGESVLLRPGSTPSPSASIVGASLQPGPTRTPIHLDTLDRSLSRHMPCARVRFLKCDVEGHELEVFQGGEAALREHHPAILVECEARHLRGHTMDDVFGYLAGLGYRGSFFLEGRAHDVSRLDPVVHQVEGRRLYVNNFAFEWKGAA